MPERDVLDTQSTHEVYKNIEEIVLEKQKLEQQLEEVKDVVSTPRNYPVIETEEQGELGRENRSTYILGNYDRRIRQRTEEFRSEIDRMNDSVQQLEGRMDDFQTEMDSIDEAIENEVNDQMIRRISAPLVLGAGILTLFAGVLELSSLSLTAIPLLGISIFCYFTWRHLSNKVDLDAASMI